MASAGLSIMGIVRAVLALVLGGASGLCAVVNVVALIENCRRRIHGENGHVSGVPVIGAVAGFLALSVAPVGTMRERLAWSWTPLALEGVTIALAYVCVAAVPDKNGLF